MRSQRHAWMECVLLLFLSAGLAPGRSQTAVPTATETEDAMRTMTQMAAVIFSGQVVAIRLPERGGGVVEIEFAVEDAVRGVPGGTYTLREWGGLWAAGNKPLRVGQRYLMLLYAAGRSGLSSPVGGGDGAIPILGGGGGGAVDLRWVAARVARTVVYAEKPAEVPTAQAFAMRARAADVDVTLAAPKSAATESGVAYAAVMGVLRGWERDAAR